MAKEEKTIQNAVEQYLSLKKIFYWKNNSGALPTASGGFIRFGAVGSPDICVVHDGTFIGLEIKTAKGKQSDNQKDFQARLEKAGGFYYLIRSVDEAMKLL